MENIIKSKSGNIDINILSDEIKNTCTMHQTIDGEEFIGTSWVQIYNILEKYGYKPELPF